MKSAGYRLVIDGGKSEGVNETFTRSTEGEYATSLLETE